MEEKNRQDAPSRYFMVWFSGFDTDGKIQDGNMNVERPNGLFINEEEIFYLVRKNFNLTDPYITNFYEFQNKEDFHIYLEPSSLYKPEDEDSQFNSLNFDK